MVGELALGRSGRRWLARAARRAAPPAGDDERAAPSRRSIPRPGRRLRPPAWRCSSPPRRGPDGEPALRIDYDFQGRGGWAAARLPLDLELPPYYEIRFLLRGEGPPNNLELKLVDPSGDNVWWHVKRDFAWPAEWTPMRVRKRQVTFAWGPLGGGEPRRHRRRRAHGVGLLRRPRHRRGRRARDRRHRAGRDDARSAAGSGHERRGGARRARGGRRRSGHDLATRGRR